MRPRTSRPSANIAKVISAVLRTLPAYLPLGFANGPTAMAQAVEAPALTVAIPAQPLPQALAAFATQTGLQLVYVSEIVNNKQSHTARAGLSARQALTRMLQGTGLRFEYLTPRSIRILASTPPARTTAAEQETNEDLAEVIVTANRRTEHLGNIPITIEVLTEETLVELNATTFDDYASYLPNVTSHGVGPGQNNAYTRGLATGGQTAVQSYSFFGSFPNVAMYLDEQSIQLPGRNVDLYTVDLARIEVLEGPQGTLFGAGAEAGVLRFITKRPELNVTDGSVSTGFAVTAHGAPSTSVSAALNLPLIDDTLAVRGVVYDERRGGYIDNTPATFACANSDVSIAYAGGTVPANSVVLSNAGLVRDNINPVTYSGAPVEAGYQINDDWSALVAQSYQRIEANGVFTEMATNSLGQPQPDLSVQLFNPSYNEDWFENSARTISGRIGALKLIYAGAARCFSPSTTWRNLERNTHQSPSCPRQSSRAL